MCYANGSVVGSAVLVGAGAGAGVGAGFGRENKAGRVEKQKGGKPSPAKRRLSRGESGPRKAACPVVPLHQNTDVVLTHVREDRTVPTRDPFDRAHKIPDVLHERLMPNARRYPSGRVEPLPGSRARKYHVSQLVRVERDRGGAVVSGVSHDSSFDSLRAVQEELDGIPGIGLNSGGGACTRSCSGASTRALAELVSRVGYGNARAWTRGRVT